MKRELPDEKKARLDAAAAAKAKRYAQLKRGVEKILSSPDTREVWKHLHWLCGWNAPAIVVAANGQVDTVATACNEQKRDVYRRLRPLAPRVLLSSVEEEIETVETAVSVNEDTKET